MSRDALLHVADIVAAGDAIRRFTIVGLRNLLAHGYWVIDAEELWDIARNKVPGFVAQLRPLLDESQ